MTRHINLALRSFARSRAYSTLNVLGLALGITCAITILLFVYDELTYDHYYDNRDSIYRLNGGWRSTTDGSSQMYASVGYNEADVLKETFPQVDEVVRIRRLWDMRFEKPGTNDFFLEYLFLTEASFFNIFNLPLLHGDANKLLPNENAIVISRKAALKYFGREDVLGETLRWLGHDTVTFEVTGVFKDYPDNTHLRIDLLARFKPPVDLREQWFEYGYFTYFTLKPNTDIAAVEDKVKFFTKPHVRDVEEEIGFIQEHTVIPFSKIHLHGHYVGELEANSNASYVYIFLVIGIFILFMACINFINLATARAVKRAKEIGIRKVVGAAKRQLVTQLLSEAFLVTVVAAVFSVILAGALLPFVNEFSGKNLELLNNPVLWVMLALVVIIVTFLAGSYPAFYLSGFRPAETLKGSFKGSEKGVFFRKALVVFQFCISVTLIAGTLIIARQLNFLRQKDLGFNKERVITITGAPREVKEKVLSLSGVSQATFSNRVPGLSVGGRTIINGWDKQDPQVVLGQLAVDYDFIDTYGLKLIAGRAFDENFPADEKEAFIVNEAALERLKIKSAEEAIGHPLWLEEWGGKKGRIVGVLKDFHFIGVNASIEPFSMFIMNTGGRYLSVKIAGDGMQETVSQIEKIYHEAAPARPFEFSFLDESFDKQYQAEDRFMLIFSFFAGVGIFIGCLGLYGLAMFMAEQRTREVGVRKVLGATTKSILVLLTSDFIKLVGIAFVIAIPVAYMGMNRWLRSFPYREEIDPLVFVVTGIVVLFIASLTVSYQALKAASANPVNSLKTD